MSKCDEVMLWRGDRATERWLTSVLKPSPYATLAATRTWSHLITRPKGSVFFLRWLDPIAGFCPHFIRSFGGVCERKVHLPAALLSKQAQIRQKWKLIWASIRWALSRGRVYVTCVEHTAKQWGHERALPWWWCSSIWPFPSSSLIHFFSHTDRLQHSTQCA